ncbi:MAG: hypothetical protein JNK05_41580 [Myxococcales bacterium]|nr:hypothetical protein [Myxococcales bacterium]
MLSPSALAAAHSMDTMWFAVDDDGFVAFCESQEDGTVPAEVTVQDTEELWAIDEIDSAPGVLECDGVSWDVELVEHYQRGRPCFAFKIVEWDLAASSVYYRTWRPFDPLRFEDLSPAAQSQCVRLPGLRFTEGVLFEPLDFVRGRTWSDLPYRSLIEWRYLPAERSPTREPARPFVSTAAPKVFASPELRSESDPTAIATLGHWRTAVEALVAKGSLPPSWLAEPSRRYLVTAPQWSLVGTPEDARYDRSPTSSAYAPPLLLQSLASDLENALAVESLARQACVERAHPARDSRVVYWRLASDEELDALRDRAVTEPELVAQSLGYMIDPCVRRVPVVLVPWAGAASRRAP